MEREAFFVGFGLAGLIGWLSVQILAGWGAIEGTIGRMFHNSPQPALNDLPATDYQGIGGDPEMSPIQVLVNGCLVFIVQIIVEIILLIGLGSLIWFFFQQNISEEFFVGAIFSAVAGILLQQLIANWAAIVNLLQMIFNPPYPVLDLDNPPNQNLLAANPRDPAFTIVLNNVLEISWRLVWQLILFYLSFQAVSAALAYLWDGEIRFTQIGVFGL